MSSMSKSESSGANEPLPESGRVSGNPRELDGLHSQFDQLMKSGEVFAILHQLDEKTNGTVQNKKPDNPDRAEEANRFYSSLATLLSTGLSPLVPTDDDAERSAQEHARRGHLDNIIPGTTDQIAKAKKNLESMFDSEDQKENISALTTLFAKKPYLLSEGQFVKEIKDLVTDDNGSLSGNRLTAVENLLSLRCNPKDVVKLSNNIHDLFDADLVAKHKLSKDAYNDRREERDLRYKAIENYLDARDLKPLVDLNHQAFVHETPENKGETARWCARVLGNNFRLFQLDGSTLKIRPRHVGEMEGVPTYEFNLAPRRDRR